MIAETELCKLLEGRPSSLPKTEPLNVSCLRFRVRRRWLFPAFQFDPLGRRILPGLELIIEAARAAGWSDLRLLNWLMRPHVDFDAAPAAALQTHPDDVLAALRRQIESQVHG